MNSKDLIKYGLLALGAYLIYKYIQDNGGISGLFGTTGGTSGLTSNGVAALNAMLNQESVASFSAAQITQLALTPAQVTILNAAAAPTNRMTADILMNQLNISSQQLAFIRSTNVSPVAGGTQTYIPIPVVNQPPAPHPPAPTPATNTSGCPAGQYMYNGVCVATGTSPSTISQRMQQAAGSNSLNMDQWAFYYSQITGQPSPVDPGSIDPSVYAGAGIVDRTTPTDVGTWLAIMQNQAPQLGLMGLGAMRYTPSWLM